MSNYKVVFLDIDGTILKPDHTYEESTKSAILQAKEKDIEVIFATGRPLHEIKELARELNIHSFIGYNGALAIYQDKTIVNEPMKSSIIEKFLEISNNHGHEMVLYTNEKNYFTSLDSPAVENFINMFQLKHNQLFTFDVADQILGATLINLKEKNPTLYEIDPSYHFSQVNVEGLLDCYDVIRDTVNKGFAVTKLLEIMEIPKESAIAFGDGMNDKEMLQAVGQSFAMGNANPDLFSYAKDKTTSVTDNGIFNGLKSIGVIN